MKWIYLFIITFSGLTIFFTIKENRENKPVIPIILETVAIIISVILLFI